MTLRPGDDRGSSPAPGSRPGTPADGAPGEAFPGAVARVDGVPAATGSQDDVPELITEEEEGAGFAAHVVALLLVTAIGVGVAVVAPGYGLDVDGQRIGPGFLPLCAGIGLAALSLVQLAVHLRAHAAGRRAAAAQADEPGAEERPDALGRTSRQRTRNMWLVAIAIVLTVVLIPLIGFLESFALMLLFTSVVVERRPILPALGITVIAVAIMYVIFVGLLDVRLPMGVLALLGLGG